MPQIGIIKSKNSTLVPLVPKMAQKFIADGYTICLESGAGSKSFFVDESYEGAIFGIREEILANSDIILMADSIIDSVELAQIKAGAILVGRFSPLTNPEQVERFKASKIIVFSLDMVPRSSIAQSMDVISSLASLAGYMAVISAASQYSGYLPMMTTAAGTVPPAKVLVLGAGVAGLQAIATAKRLGAVVDAFDVRAAVKEEVESLGAKFIEVEGSDERSDAGGYAIEQSEDYQKRQKALIQEKVIKADLVICTANIPGRRAPLLIEEAIVKNMQPGSVIVDMASASGGNCEPSVDNSTVKVGDVTIIGDSKLFEKLPKEASRLYSNNIYNFLKFVLKDGKESILWEHEILEKTALNRYSSVPSEA